MSKVGLLNESRKGFPRRHKEGLFSAISAGIFFILVGMIFVNTPNLFDQILDFFHDFDIVNVPNTEIALPAPEFPSIHSAVYSAATQFCFVWGLFQAIILLVRFVAHSLLSKKAETVSNLVFWLGASFLIHTFLNATTTTTTWFVFWTGVITLLGASLIVRAITLTSRM